MTQCALVCSNVCKKCSLCANNNKGTLVIGDICFAYKRIAVVDTTIKICLSANPIINLFTNDLHVSKQQHPPTAN